MPRLGHLLRSLLPAALLVSCGPATTPGPLTVFAASSLTEAFGEIADTLEARNPGLEVTLNLAGSQALALQLREGAAADLFASADRRWMREMIGDSLMGDTATFARNRLVLVTPLSNPAGIDSVQQLARRGLKLVLAAEAVPAGRYARSALMNLSLRKDFPRGFSNAALANVVSHEENVRAVLARIELGEADAGIVYRSDVTGAASATVRIIPMPDDPHAVPLLLGIGVVRRTVNLPAAKAFFDLVLSPAGQAILHRHGFLPVMEQP